MEKTKPKVLRIRREKCKRKVKTILTFEMLRENEVRSLWLNFLYFLTEVEGNLQATDEEAINIYEETLREKLQNFNKNKRIWRFEKVISLQGVKLTFFSDSHFAPKFFKVVANSKKVGRHFQRQTKSFFTLSAF